MDHSFRRAVAEARRQGDLYFAGLLSEDRINEAFGNARSLWQGWIYNPIELPATVPRHRCASTVAGPGGNLT